MQRASCDRAAVTCSAMDVLQSEAVVSSSTFRGLTCF